MRKKMKTSDAVAQLIRGDYDHPLRLVGSGKNSGAILQLETLRVGLRDLRDETEDEIRRQELEIASVAHDLKTPLTVIAGYAECIMDNMTDRDYAALIAEKAEQMNEQVLAIVDSARKKDSREFREKVDAHSYFAEELQKYKPLAAAKKQSYHIGKIPRVELRVGKKEIGAVLQNIVSNAVKYTPEGGKIQIKFFATSYFFTVSVRDSGKGISKEDLPRVFDKFFMADKSRTDSSSSGLGLYTAKKSAESYGGKLSVRSKLGKGSKFMLALPLEYFGRGLARFEASGKFIKLIPYLFTGLFAPSVYRFVKFSKTRQISTLIGGLILLPFFFVGWFVDVINICVSNEISYLSA